MRLLGLFERRFVVGAGFGDLGVTLALERHNLVVAVAHQLLGFHLGGQGLVFLGVGALVNVRVPEILMTRLYNTENKKDVSLPPCSIGFSSFRPQNFVSANPKL